MRFAIWYHLYNLKSVENTYGRVLVSVKLQAKTCNFAISNTPACAFSRFLTCKNDTKSSNASHMSYAKSFKKEQLFHKKLQVR